jgi:hypothetical protein
MEHIINRVNFFQVVRGALFNGKLKQTQVDGMTAILGSNSQTLL